MSASTESSQEAAGASPQHGELGVAAAFILLTAALVMTQSRITLIIWALDGMLALAIVVAATLAGHALLSLFRLGTLPPSWRWLLCAGLGLGLLATLALVCGVAGLIGPGRRWVAPAALGVLAVVGLALALRAPEGEGESAANEEGAGRMRWLLLTVAPFAALAMLVATLPPGFLWSEEGYGYDVLEYHLQLPREYYEAGEIRYLPHNVYANFPSNAEMLYLFGNLVAGETVEAWPIAKCLNALLAVLTVMAAWLAGREHSPHAGIATAILAASVGWLVYLSGVAYVENGMLLMGLLSVGCVIRAAGIEQAALRKRWVLAAGVLAGLSCGFKYPAVAMIALPVGILMLTLLPGTVGGRLRRGAWFTIAALIGFSPWLIKNAAMTGNPVFPLAGNVFTSHPPGWGAEEAEHFAWSHQPAEEESSLTARLGLLWRHVVADPSQRFGAVPLALAAVALLRRRSRSDLALLVMLIVQLAVWLFATHLYARFAVPMLVPLVLLAGHGAVDRAGRMERSLLMIVVLGVVLNGYNTLLLYVDHTYTQDGKIAAEGATYAFTQGLIGPPYDYLGGLNAGLPDDASVLLVGDARPFYILKDVDYSVVFNRSPFVEAVETSATLDDVIQWLQEHGYTHVLVHWQEIERLRRSRYGFPEAITWSLFDQLEDAGLERLESYTLPLSERPYAVLYRVPD